MNFAGSKVQQTRDVQFRAQQQAMMEKKANESNKIAQSSTSHGGRAFAFHKSGQILTWSKYTDNQKPLRLDESFGRRKMAVVIPRKVADAHRKQLREPRRYTDIHVSDSVNIRDFIEPRSTFRRSKPEPVLTHFNIAKFAAK